MPEPKPSASGNSPRSYANEPRFRSPEILGLAHAGRLHLVDQFAETPTEYFRVGKTYLCYQRIKELLGEGVPRENILYLNFEDDCLFGFELADCQTILEVFYRDRPEKKSEPCYFFFDEIQNIPHWERFIRRLIDTEQVTVYVTGSSAKLRRCGRPTRCHRTPWRQQYRSTPSSGLSRIAPSHHQNSLKNTFCLPWRIAAAI